VKYNSIRRHPTHNRPSRRGRRTIGGIYAEFINRAFLEMSNVYAKQADDLASVVT
jgi:hypothetical protein